ncbi:DUF6945 domain-containing protein [Aeromonas veronii]|uniref:DUF6945 domain-containing protein n=1 Tax=Aeromonas veronii TaxID=654 RepID=UPI0022479FA4|nr:hypothetical protein [Aeromonas veronii]MCX0437099.1 hypothetical protein [Aeromonas veronii]
MSKTRNNNNNGNVYVNGLYTGIYKGDNGNFLTATHMIYEVDGDEVIVQIENDFKLLYTFVYDQYRSFQAQQKDLFAEWKTIFMALGRSYNTKSKAMVKLLEDCGLLKQIKMPNSNARIKIVADVSLKNIRFVNPDYDAWRAEQQANNAERVAEYAAFNEAKEQAKSETKKQPIKPVVKPAKPKEPEQTVKPVEQPEQKQIEPEIQINTQTKWFTNKDALIAQNNKYSSLSDGQQMCVMLKVNSCMSSNFYAIKEAFNNEIARLTYQPETKQADKPKPSSSVVPPAIQAMNDAFNDDDDNFGDSDIPF